MNERLIHFSDERVTELHTRFRDPGAFKPEGFWLSVEGNGDGWSDWCRDNDFHLPSLKYVHEVTLRPDANILRIRTVEELDAFSAQWSTPDALGFVEVVDWAGVAQAWQGLIISPYQWARRMDLMWYYGWDCASGCIWDVAAVESLQVTQTLDIRVSSG